MNDAVKCAFDFRPFGVKASVSNFLLVLLSSRSSCKMLDCILSSPVTVIIAVAVRPK